MEFMKILTDVSQKEQLPKTNTKYKFSQITFEITRKCNMKCAHCLRGKMQPVSMSKEVIDKLFEVSKGIDSIFLTGGEPFLEPDIIEYLVDKIIENDFDVSYLGVITNGTILNDRGIRCAKAFDRFADWRSQKDEVQQEWYSNIEVSNDAFHDSDVDKAVDFYKACTHHTWVYKQKCDGSVSPYGNALDNHLSNTIRVPDEEYKYRLLIGKEDYVHCILDLTYDGKLAFIDCKEWSVIDKNIIGDIMNETLDVIMERNQWEEYQCREVKLLNASKRAMLENKESSYDYIMAKYAIQCLEKVKKVRSRAHRMLPYLDYVTICYMADCLMELNTSRQWMKFLYGDAQKLSEVTEEFLENFIEQCTEENSRRRKNRMDKARCVPFDAVEEHCTFCEYDKE